MQAIVSIIFVILFLVTPSITLAATIKLNEFYSAGGTSSNPDWVEIYSEGENIDLYQLVDDWGNINTLSTVICSGNFCTVNWDSKLNKNEDTIKLVLKSSPETIIDQVIYGSADIPAPTIEQSTGRSIDGAGAWITFATPSKGFANSSSPSSAPTTLPTPIPQSSPTAAPSPTAVPTPSSSPTATPLPKIFEASEIPNSTSSNQSFTVKISMQNFESNTKFYLKGAFVKEGSSNYFGQTLVDGSWVKNNSTFSSQIPITTNATGSWSGSISIKADQDDSGYQGDGNYIFKVARYSSTGGGPNWSNSSNIALSSANDSATSTVTPFSSPIVNVLTPSPSVIQSNQTLASNKARLPDGLVASTSSKTIKSTSSGVLGEKNIATKINNHLFTLSGASLFLFGVGILVYIRKRG